MSTNIKKGHVQFSTSVPAETKKEYDIAIAKNDDGNKKEVLIKLLEYYTNYGLPTEGKKKNTTKKTARKKAVKKPKTKISRKSKKGTKND